MAGACRTCRRSGKPIYNKPDAERAWAKLVALYKRALVDGPKALRSPWRVKLGAYLRRIG